MKSTNFYFFTISILVLSSAMFQGCKVSEQGAGVGVVAGSVIGGVLGHQVDGEDGAVTGAVIGGILGGLAGHQYGKSIELKQDKFANQEAYLDELLATTEKDINAASKTNEALRGQVASLEKTVNERELAVEEKKRLSSNLAKVESTRKTLESVLQKLRDDYEGESKLQEISSSQRGELLASIKKLESELADMRELESKLSFQLSA